VLESLGTEGIAAGFEHREESWEVEPAVMVLLLGRCSLAGCSRGGGTSIVQTPSDPLSMFFRDCVWPPQRDKI
jgi:hypothetical protein